MTEVLKELRVEVTRYNIFEDKSAIATLPATLKEADGVILATTVEWFGIGGYMQQFLDMCWMYADKQELSSMYMLPVAMATTYGERDAELSLIKAWETLGGIPLTGLAAYVENLDEFEQNEEYSKIIEKKTETLYRSIHQKTKSLPTSTLAVKTNLLKTKTIDLTPQESEQLSRFVSDESYVKQQKEDIEELATMFKDMLGQQASTDDMPYIKELEAHFIPLREFKACYSFNIEGIKNPLYIKVDEDKLDIHYGEEDIVDVYAKFSKSIMESIIDGHMTFQRAFMTGEMTAKGNFKTLRMLDQIFPF